jgi:hypothetical protein
MVYKLQPFNRTVLTNFSKNFQISNPSKINLIWNWQNYLTFLSTCESKNDCSYYDHVWCASLNEVRLNNEFKTVQVSWQSTEITPA